jgi:hypothetical protein
VIVLCAGCTLLLTLVVCPATSQLATLSEVTPFSYWSIKPWFITGGKLVVLITPSSWGFQTVSTTATKIVWCRTWSTISEHGIDYMLLTWLSMASLALTDHGDLRVSH